MPEEGSSTGIYHRDVDDLGVVEFEGRQAQLYGCYESGDGNVRLELDTFSGSGPRLALYGYYGRGDEFLEVHRERLG